MKITGTRIAGTALAGGLCLLAAACATAPSVQTEEAIVKEEKAVAERRIVDISAEPATGRPAHLTLAMSDIAVPEGLLFAVPWYGDTPQGNSNFYKPAIERLGSWALQVAASSQRSTRVRGLCWDNADLALAEIEEAYALAAARFGLGPERIVAIGGSQGAAPLFELILAGKVKVRGAILAIALFSDEPTEFWPRGMEGLLARIEAATDTSTAFAIVSGKNDERFGNAKAVAAALERKGFRVLFIEGTGDHSALMSQAANLRFEEALAFFGGK